jgi:signal transduction histidine kinase/HAMP domain-containing protein
VKRSPSRSTWQPRTLRAQLFLALLLVGLVPLALLGIGSALLQREAIGEQSARELTGLARGLAGELDTYFDGLLSETRALAALPDITSMDADRQREALTGLFLHHAPFTRLSIFDTAGQRLVSSHSSGPDSIPERDSFETAVLRGQQDWEVGPLKSTGRQSLLINTPIRDRERRVVGVLGAVVDLQSLSAVLARVPLGGGGRAIVLDSESRVLLHPDTGPMDGRSAAAWIGISPGSRPVGPGTARYDSDGEPRRAGYAPVQSLGWTVVVDLPEAEVLAPAERSWQLALAGLVGSAMLGLFGATVLARRLTHQLRELSKAATHLAEGSSAGSTLDFEPAETELGALVEAFTRMQRAVGARERSLRLVAHVSRDLAASLDYDETLRSVAWALVPDLADWCFVDLLGPDGEIRRVEVAHADPSKSELAAQLRRFPPSPNAREGIGRVLSTGEPELTPDYPASLLPAVTTGADHLRLVQQLGVRSCIRVPLVAGGRVLGVLSLVSAQSDRRYEREDLRLAEEVGRRAALAIDHARAYHEARDAIRARDEFLSIASHELRTPVAIIRTSAQMLVRAQTRGDLNVERLARSTQSIDEATGRLTRLIEDLLDVSRIRTGRLPLETSTLDLAALLRSLAERYEDQLDERHKLVLKTAPQGPLVTADAGRLEQVLTNLIENAIKYSPDGGEIRVGLRRQDGGALLTVQDPGIGLSEGANELIFQPFGRAPNAAERHIPGLGLGLYICRSIIDRHGGRIWAESAGPGRGTTMSVWLPTEVSAEVSAAASATAAAAPAAAAVPEAAHGRIR